MTAQTNVLYLHPAYGGIADYSQTIETIYQRNGVMIISLPVTGREKVGMLTAQVLKLNFDVIHFEIGAGDEVLYRLSRALLRKDDRRQIITIHDPGVIVRNPFPVWGVSSPYSPLRFVAKVLRKVLNLALRASTLDWWLAHPNIIVVYLRPDLADEKKSFYLPQPTYHEDIPAVAAHTPRLVFGFAGFWGLGKGLETLLEAWEMMAPSGDYKLVIAGDTVDPSDPYSLSIKSRVANMKYPPTLAGYLSDDDMDPFLASLTALVLPYWPELPNGTSAMAMRAAELATPIIASDIPSVKLQLSEDGPTYVVPKDAEALAEAMTHMLKNSAGVRVRALALQKRIYLNSGWDAVAKYLSRILTQARATK